MFVNLGECAIGRVRKTLVKQSNTFLRNEIYFPVSYIIPSDLTPADASKRTRVIEKS